MSNAVLMSNGSLFSRFCAKQYRVVLVHLHVPYTISYSCTVVFIHTTSSTLVYHVPHADHVVSSIIQNGEAWLRQPHAYLIHVSVNELNHSGADAQVVSCHRYLVVFHPFVEQLASSRLQCACVIAVFA